MLLTAIIVAGRSGSAFAAEIGAMKLNEEVDALHAIGVEPHEVLILPRVIGLVIAMPLLTVIADGIGLTGGALLCKWLLDMPLPLYLDRVQDAIAPTTFWVGIIKAPVFGLLIALSGHLPRPAGAGFLARARPPDHRRRGAVHLPGDLRERHIRHRVLAAGHMSARMSEAVIEVRGLGIASARRSCTTGST